ncbi:hypothetical protein [Natronorubrum thiooxidans]|uniref:Uncharacterized protein n=1 Tax=Natronorubrum thiooxidans TaxID=308853 RepID=A0A1N7GUE5_9EURY|nr:hypothetical protein [Natronorubrum thiooxidans]SIS16211.1 hypothetical protein SAMN05421752_115108 [Natronorubrum thiooxidans]
MADSEMQIDDKAIKKIQDRVLREEMNQLHYQRPPSIIQDLQKIIEEEITEADISEKAD